MSKRIIFLALFLMLFSLFSCKKKGEEKQDTEYILSYHYDNKVDQETYKENTSVNLKSLNLVGFVGWYEDPSYKGEKLDSVVMNKNIDVYAKIENKYKLTFHYLDTAQEIMVADGTKLKDIEKPNVLGYEIVGYYLTQDLNESFLVDDNFEIIIDTNIYLKLSPISYTVSFDSQGAQEIKSQKVNYGMNIKRTERPCKLNYSFKYWTLDLNTKEEFLYTTPIMDNLVLYAVYDEVSYNDILDEYIPDEIEESLDLPFDDLDVEFVWSSSNEEIFLNSGIYNPVRSDVEIEVGLEVVSKGTGESQKYQKTVLVKGYNLKDLVPGDVVIGYTSSWYYKGYSEEVLKTVDVLDISFAYVYDDASLKISDIQTMLTKAVGIAHKAGVRMCLSIQGYGEATEQFSNCAADPTLRVKLAANMVEMVRKYHLDGIDIDWEYPGSYSGRIFTEDRKNYTLLMKEIREGLDKLGSGYLLTAAIPSWGAGNFEMSALAQYFDYYNMMSYDLENPNCGSHHAALNPSSVSGGTTVNNSISESLVSWVNAGVPKEKILIGIAFYGKSIIVNGTLNNGLGMAKSTTTQTKYNNIAYAALMEQRLSQIGKPNNYTYNFDYSSHAPYQFRASTKYFTTYENELSILYKCDYAKDNNLGGVMIWEIGEDSTNTLIKAVAQGMNKWENEEIIVGSDLQISIDKKEVIIKPVNEVINSVLKEDLIYYADNDKVEIIKQDDSKALLKLKETGNVTVFATSSDKTVNYGILNLEIK